MWPPGDKVATDELPYTPTPGKLASLIAKSHRAGLTAEEWNFDATRTEFRQKMEQMREEVNDHDLLALYRYRVHTPKGWRFFGPEHIASGRALSIHRWRQQWPRSLPSTCGRNAQCSHCKWLTTHLTTLPSLELCARSAADMWVGEQ